MQCSKPEWISTLTALGPLIIGIFGIAVAIAGAALARAQYVLAKRKRADDLFDRRYDFYQRLRAAWMDTGVGAPEDSDPAVYIEDVVSLAEEASFLFGADIEAHIYSLVGPGHQGSQFFPDESFVEPFRKYLSLERGP